MEDNPSLRTSRIGQKPNLAPSLEELRSRLNSENAYKAFKYSALTFSESLSRLLSSVQQNPHLEISQTPLIDLERTSLEQLRLLVCAKGGYLILRTLQAASPSRDQGIKTIVEDHEGTVVVFVVFNLTDEPNPNLHILLPVGTVVVLKEPYMDETDYGECFLRCESPSDLIVLYREHENFGLCKGISWRNVIEPEVDFLGGHPMPQNALQWKSRGNVLRQFGQYDRAIRCYLLCLKNVNGSARDQQLQLSVRLVLSNLYSQLGFFESSLRMAKKILKGNPKHLDTLLLAGRACYSLRKYAMAKTYFRQFYLDTSKGKYIKKEFWNCQKRLMEQRTGDFDLFKMFATQLEKPRLSHDFADYVGPIKFLRRSNNYEKPAKPKCSYAMIATRDLKPGTLLVVSKALAFSWRPNSVYDRRPFNYLYLIAQLTQMIVKNPETYGRMVFSLPGIDSMVDRSPPKVFCDPETKMEPIVDVRKLKEIILRNIMGDSEDVSRVSRLIEQGKIHKSGFGLFVVPSCFNFGCIPNTSVHEFNDVLVVRTVQRIREGKQVFLPDAVSRVEFSFRQALMSPRRGFAYTCICRLCHMANRLPFIIMSQRRRLIEIFEGTYDMVSHVIRGEITDFEKLIFRLESVRRQLEDTYQPPEATEDNLDMSSVFAMLAAANSKHPRNDYFKFLNEILLLEMALKCLGFNPDAMLSSVENKKEKEEERVNNSNFIQINSVLNPTTMFVVCGLIRAHANLRNIEMKNKWTRILCVLEKVYSGGDARVVNLRYPNCITVNSQNNIFNELKGF